MEKRFDLVGIGSMVVDMIYRTPRIIGSEEKISLQSYPSGEVVRKLLGESASTTSPGQVFSACVLASSGAREMMTMVAFFALEWIDTASIST